MAVAAAPLEHLLGGGQDRGVGVGQAQGDAPQLLEAAEPLQRTVGRVRPAPKPSADPAFSAQLMGQDGQKRGLKGGAPVLDAARSSYLGREYSGANERRPTAGKTTKTEI